MKKTLSRWYKCKPSPFSCDPYHWMWQSLLWMQISKIWIPGMVLNMGPTTRDWHNPPFNGFDRDPSLLLNRSLSETIKPQHTDTSDIYYKFQYNNYACNREVSRLLQDSWILLRSVPSQASEDYLKRVFACGVDEIIILTLILFLYINIFRVHLKTSVEIVN